MLLEVDARISVIVRLVHVQCNDLIQIEANHEVKRIAEDAVDCRSFF